MKTTRFILVLAFTLSAISSTAQSAVSYTSTADGRQTLRQNHYMLAKKAESKNVITMDKSKRYQTVDGFGYALTYSSCYNLLKMRQDERAKLLTQIYSPKKGYGVSYARISIGCNDFSSTEYSLCDTKGPDSDLLSNFALQSDETKYVIPILKEILAINPNLKIIAAPWTCPKWMKVEDMHNLQEKDSWTDGHLNPKYRDTYAQYFVKFVKAMQDNGIDIYAVSPQNEPLNKANCASLYMPWEEEAPFVKSLARAFHENGLKTLIYVFDHNFNYDNKADQKGYPLHVYDILGKGFPGEELVAGAAYHDYGGDPEEMTDIHDKRPDKQLIFTEESIGTWNHGRDLQRTLIRKMERSGILFLKNWARSVIVWNLMLDDRLGPNLDGGCQTCYGAIDISSKDYSTLSYNSHYYLINHLSAVIKPGAQRIDTEGWKTEGLDYVAFQNTDGSFAMLIVNGNKQAQKISINDEKGRYMNVEIPSDGIMSVRFD